MTQCSPSEFIQKALVCDTMAVDVETNGQDIRDGRGFAIGISAAVRHNGEYYGAYFPVAHENDNVDEETKEMLFKLIQTRPVVCAHNIKFDTIALETAGYDRGFKRLYCTMMMAHFLNENLPKGLDWLAKHELQEPGKKKSPVWEFYFAMHGWSPKFPPEVMGEYAIEDAILCLKLFYRLHPYFVKSGFDGSQV